MPPFAAIPAAIATLAGGATTAVGVGTAALATGAAIVGELKKQGDAFVDAAGKVAAYAVNAAGQVVDQAGKLVPNAYVDAAGNIALVAAGQELSYEQKWRAAGLTEDPVQTNLRLVRETEEAIAAQQQLDRENAERPRGQSPHVLVLAERGPPSSGKLPVKGADGRWQTKPRLAGIETIAHAFDPRYGITPQEKIRSEGRIASYGIGLTPAELAATNEAAVRATPPPAEAPAVSPAMVVGGVAAVGLALYLLRDKRR